MSVGTQYGSSQIDTNLTILTNALRKVMEQLIDQIKQINGMGQSGLETAGYSAADAATVLQYIGYLTTVTGVYYGTDTQTTDFDFDNAFAALWGGQVQ
jgi:hypothetical protein